MLCDHTSLSSFNWEKDFVKLRFICLGIDCQQTIMLQLIFFCVVKKISALCEVNNWGGGITVAKVNLNCTIIALQQDI